MRYLMHYILDTITDELILALPAAVITAVIYWFVRRAIHKKRLGIKFKEVRKKALLNEIIRLLLIFWAIIVFGGTLLPSRIELHWHYVNHLWRISEFITTPYFGNFFDLIFESSHSGLNIMMFVPIGLALPFVLKKENFGKVILIGFCMTASIEFLQAFVRREASLGDIICNTLGAAAGYGLYLLMKLIFPRFTEKCKTKVKQIK